MTIQTRRDRFIEIDAELKQLSTRRRELLAERRRLSGVRDGRITNNVWLDPIFKIIAERPGVSRHDIFVELGSPHMTWQELTNALTALRRRGWIENRGTRKHPEWYSRGI